MSEHEMHPQSRTECWLERILDAIVSGGGGGEKNKIFVQTEEPTNATEGDFWINSDTHEAKVKHEGAWVEFGGGGLPTPTADGVALIGVDGEWKQQSGYGYESEGLTIEWDGETEGRETIDEVAQYCYKVSDIAPYPDNGLLITLNNLEFETGEATISYFAEDIPIWKAESVILHGKSLIVGVIDDFETEGVVFHKGMYFYSDGGNYVSKALYKPTVHTIDPKFIPSKPVMELNVEIEFEEGYGYRGTCDKTSAEIYEAIQNGYDVIWDNSAQGVVFHYISGDKYNSYLIAYWFNEAEPLDIAAAMLKVDRFGDCSATNGYGNGTRILTQQDFFEYYISDEPFGWRFKLVNDHEVSEYVNERLNDAIPTPSEDGEALISVGGEWAKQTGYGYEASVNIEWDGESPGVYVSRELSSYLYYKVSDSVFTKAELEAMTFYDENGDEITGGGVSSYTQYTGVVYSNYVLSGIAGTYGSGEPPFTVPEDGTYFRGRSMGYNHYVSKMEKVDIHTIDPKFIPTTSAPVLMVEFTETSNGVSSDKTVSEIVEAASNGTAVFGYFKEQHGGNIPCMLVLSDYGVYGDHPFVDFVGTSYTGHMTEFSATHIGGDSDGWDIERKLGLLVPNAGAMDEGKILKVVDGVPAWVNP